VKLPKTLQDKTWHTQDGDLTSADLERVLDAVRDGAPSATALPGAVNGCDRRVDRAHQVLRKAGLIRFSRGKWWLKEAKP
jgi:hypothetical protein